MAGGFDTARAWARAVRLRWRWRRWPQSPPRLEADGICLTPLEPALDEPLVELVERERGSSLTGMDGWRDAGPEDVARHVAGSVRYARRATGFHFAVRRAGELCGVAVLDEVSLRRREAELGLWLASAHQGGGHARTAMRLLVDFARELDLETLYAVAESEDGAVAATRLGFEPVPPGGHDERTHELHIARDD
jgi:RimJ/RimL family protein N-acetyltransferase